MRALRSFRGAVCCLALALGLLVLPARGQTFDVVHSFAAAGGSQARLLQGADGKLYGTAVRGGTRGAGSVFALAGDGTGGFTITTIHSFSNGDGAAPVSGLIQAADGNFYGTTSEGGDTGCGTVFKMDASGNLTTLHSFGGDGCAPHAGLIQAADGSFYGTTSLGGANGYGTAFRMETSGNLTTLHSFTYSDGATPSAALIQAADGNFYGTTQAGGGGGGTAFKMDAAGTITVLHSFQINVEGVYPRAGLTQGTDGNFYGTTYDGGGVNVHGTAFRMSASGSFTTLHSFGFGIASFPVAGLIQATDGNFYGTTTSGGDNNFGIAFKMDGSGTVTTLHSFTSGDGSSPMAAFTQAPDGSFYGTTYTGGATGLGTVFKMDASGNVTVLSALPSDGASPHAGLTLANDGNFYGTTYQGGVGGNGTTFKMDASGNVTTLHAFANSDGASPTAGLIQGSDGNFYGTTEHGGNGATPLGTAFRVDASGNLTTLHSFLFASGAGAYPVARLFQTADGSFYGTTQQGGTGNGVVFKIDASGNFTTLHAFTSSEGNSPSAGLIRTTDGTFYGTAFAGGGGGRGTVFKMDASGNITGLRSFTSASNDGAFPYAGLIQGTDGNFYGTTTAGGQFGRGTVFKMSAFGLFTILHSFTGTDGTAPYADLIQASDGNLYGTTSAGGTVNKGTVFRIDASGTTFTSLHSFNNGDGATPYASLVQAGDGSLYGTTSGGGPGAGGVVFRMTLVSCPPPAVANDGPICAGQTLHLTATTVAGATYSWTGPNGFASNLQNPTIPNASSAASGVYSVTTTVGTCTSTAATTTATVRPPPTAAASGSATITPGASTPLTGSGGVSCSWSPTAGLSSASSCSPTASPTATTTYTLTVTDANGCVSANNPAVTVTVLPVPKLTVTKVVVNDNGGTRQVGDFPLFVDGGPVTSGFQNTFNTGIHTVSESSSTGYGATFGGACASNGSVSLNPGDVKTCTITNDDFPPAPYETKLTASDMADFDQFGNSVAISGDTAVIGSIGDDDTGTNSGSAYVFVRTASGWIQKQKLTASDGAAFHEFGQSVAINGDTLVVGAFRDPVAGSDSGSAYVFVRNGGVWSQQQKLTATDVASGDLFGNSVAVSGETIVVGAGLDDDAGTSSGSAYVFVRSGGVWSQQQKLTASDGAAFDFFGVSVAVGGDTAVIGSYQYRGDDSGPQTGSAYVYVRSGGVWTQQQKLTANDAASNDQFGISVAISGDTAVVGSYLDDTVGPDFGSAYVFVRTGGVWIQQQRLTASDGATGDFFGFSVAVSDDMAVVGAYNDDDAGSSSGSAYVFARSGGVWSQQRKLTASDAAASDLFGHSVAVSEGTVVVGSHFDHVASIWSGSAYVYVPPACTPPTAVAGGTAAICVGSSTALSGSGSVSCSWSPATGLSSAASCSPIASPSATTTYTLTVTDANGCVSTNSPTVTVTVNPPPTASVSGSAAVCAGDARTIQAALTGIGPWNLTWSDGATQTGVGSSPASRSVSPSETTTYTVTAVSDATCAGTSSGNAVITVNAHPTAVASGSASICPGSSTPLTGSGGVSCSWSPSTGLSSAASCSPTASPSATTTYTLTVTDANGCVSTNSPTVTVTVNPLPAATITASGATTFCAGGSVTLTASAGSSYLWSTGATTQAIPVATSGSYSVTVTDSNGCVATSAATTVTVNPRPTAVASGTATIVTGSSTPLGGSGGVSCSWSPTTGLSSASSCSPTASPAVTTTYTLTVTAANGCPSTNDPTVTVTVLPAPKLTVIKVVVNNNGGTKVVANFPLFVDATPVSSGVQNTFSTGAHTVSETSSPGYAATFSGDCAPSGSLALNPGDVKSCTITNDDFKLPDLTVSALTVPTAAVAGSDIAVTATTQNVTGAGAAADSMTYFFLSANTTLDSGDTFLGAQMVPALPAGGGTSTGPAFLTIPAGTATGTRYIIAKADGGETLFESIETNNTRSASIKISPPDLIVSAVAAPATGGAGFSITVTDTTKNQGAGPAASSTTKFYLSTDSNWDAGDTLLGSRVIAALAPAGTSSGSTSLTIPGGTAAGTWYVIAKADADTVVLETIETNNTASDSIVIGPDLIVSALSAPATGGAGLSIAVTDTTKNQGAGSAGATTTRFYLSANSTWEAGDTLLGSRAIAVLAPGAAGSGSTSLTIPVGTAPGTWYVIAKADADSLVPETTETNNTTSDSILIGPDLIVSVLSAPSTGGAGLPITVTDTTKNQGAGSAPASTTKFYLSTNSTFSADDVLLASRAVAALNPGATSAGSTPVTIPAGTAVGAYYIIAVGDAAGIVAETDETNNTRTSPINLSPDLIVSALSAPTSAIAGANISVTDTTKNQGQGTAAATTTTFYLSANTTWEAGDVVLKTRAIPVLASGASSSGSTSAVTIPAGTVPGAWYVLARADAAGAVAESNETNNITSKAITITP